MMGFFTAHVNAQLSKLRTVNARLHSANCDLRVNNDWLAKEARRLLDENRFLRDELAATHSSLAAAVENNRKLGMALFRALGHPSVRSETAKTMGLN